MSQFKHEVKLHSIHCYYFGTGRIEMSQEDVDTMNCAKKIDNIVFTPGSLVSYKRNHREERIVGYFANTLEELTRKVNVGDEEILYDILDESEMCRYVTCKNHRCYALFLPDVFVPIFLNLQQEDKEIFN